MVSFSFGWNDPSLRCRLSKRVVNSLSSFASRPNDFWPWDFVVVVV